MRFYLAVFSFFIFSSQVQLLFSNPIPYFNNLTSSPCNDKVDAFIEKLREGCTLWAVIYAINSRNTIELINQARRRGVNVNIITDSQQYTQSHSDALLFSKEFPLMSCGNKPGQSRVTVHSKFIITQCPLGEGKFKSDVILGSPNWTIGAIHNNFEACLVWKNVPFHEMTKFVGFYNDILRLAGDRYACKKHAGQVLEEKDFNRGGELPAKKKKLSSFQKSNPLAEKKN